jgi:hypothetical protein
VRGSWTRIGLPSPGVPRDDRARRDQAVEYLLSIANGETDYDFERAREIHAEREAGRG